MRVFYFYLYLRKTKVSKKIELAVRRGIAWLPVNFAYYISIKRHEALMRNLAKCLKNANTFVGNNYRLSLVHKDNYMWLNCISSFNYTQNCELV